MKKSLIMPDGMELLIRYLKLDDLEKLLEFYTSLPGSDRRYLRIDVTNKTLVEKRIWDSVCRKDIRLAAFHNGQIIATGALEFFPDNWRKNQAEMRIIVSRSFQRKGIGLAMSHELYLLAAEKGVKKLMVNMMKPQKGAQNMVTRLGFQIEAVIPNNVKDQFGRMQDTVRMAFDMKKYWKDMERDKSFSDWQRCR